MTKYLKIATASIKKVLASAPVEKQEPPTKDKEYPKTYEKDAEPVKAEAEPKKTSDVPVKMEYKHTVACPHCSGEFAVDYNPAKPQAEEVKPEVKAEDKEDIKEKAESKFEEEGTGKEKNEKTEPDVIKDKKEDEDKETPKKQALTAEGFKQAAFGIKIEKMSKSKSFTSMIEAEFNKFKS